MILLEFADVSNNKTAHARYKSPSEERRGVDAR
jgi:hypothetical protein